MMNLFLDMDFKNFKIPPFKNGGNSLGGNSLGGNSLEITTKKIH
jgi:hypothetical protein